MWRIAKTLCAFLAVLIGLCVVFGVWVLWLIFNRGKK